MNMPEISQITTSDFANNLTIIATGTFKDFDSLEHSLSIRGFIVQAGYFRNNKLTVAFSISQPLFTKLAQTYSKNNFEVVRSISG